MHVRKRIRDGALAALTGLPHTADRVFVNRRDPLSKSELPAIRLMTPDSTPGLVALSVEAIASIEGEVETLADWLDEIAVTIEAAIDADPTFGGAAIDATLSSAAIIVDNEGETPVAVLAMQYAVTADTTARAPAVKIAIGPDFVRVERQRSLGLTQNSALADTTHSHSVWRALSEKTKGEWSATIEVRRDPAAPAQNAMTLKSRHQFEFYPSGLNAPPLTGVGIVAGIEDETDGVETIRVYAIAGDGPLA